MMTPNKLSLLFILFLCCQAAISQVTITGTVNSAAGDLPIEDVAVYEKNGGLLATTLANGTFSFTTTATSLNLTFFTYDYTIFEQQATVATGLKLNIVLQPLSQQLTAIEIKARKERVFQMKRLKDVEGTSIYAGKKTEVVLLEKSTANLAANNTRQIYNQVAGLNIFQNDDAGLQLNIGGRGLDPNRTANFNTRQNGYDISADVLGYPESYYAPASEGLQEIQIIRGAASLQYGTQFGGLINFVMKDANPTRNLELITRNTLGSYGLYTNFTSASGTVGKWNYYTFFNYKKGDGFRPNSQFESKNTYTHIGYDFNDNTTLSAQFTYLHYLAQQAGGLTDAQFAQDRFQSNRERNWFQVNWLLYNLKLEHRFSERTTFSFNAFGLTASRDALGFRSNRVNQEDPGGARDLIKGAFSNYGFESRLVSRYKIADKKITYLVGAKFYKANNTSAQGPGSDGGDANFNFQTDRFPNYPDQNDFRFPNLNIAVFSEHILYLNDKLSITPGLRVEYINTQSDGFFQRINTDAAGNVILKERVTETAVNERSLALLGIGTSYKATTGLEVYGNISQNYRSVTFTDISTVNPAFAIDPNISDEKGFTTDLGIRGNYKDYVSYDANVFGLFYNNRIGFVQRAFNDGSVKSLRTNVGDAVMYGVESLIDFNLNKLFIKSTNYSANLFFNTSIIQSEYTASSIAGVAGNKVEFVPEFNFKTGLTFGYKNLIASAQYSYLSQQFTDASNALDSNLSGIIGAIPSYDIIDASLSYQLGRFKLETGVNNLLDNAYFTRRATGYPGPGIIPDPPRNFYMTFEVKF